MALGVVSSATIGVLTTHRLAGTALASSLRNSLATNVEYARPEQRWSFPVAVLLAHYEKPAALPRMLVRLREADSRIVFVYDALRPSEQLLDTAALFQVAGVCDAHDRADAVAEQIKAVTAGYSWSHERASAEFSRSLRGSGQHLTSREAQVVDQYCSSEGLSPAEIATRLELSINTVRAHLANVRRKLPGVYTGNRDALRHALLERGWLD